MAQVLAEIIDCFAPEHKQRPDIDRCCKRGENEKHFAQGADVFDHG